VIAGERSDRGHPGCQGVACIHLAAILRFVAIAHNDGGSAWVLSSGCGTTGRHSEEASRRSI